MLFRSHELPRMRAAKARKCPVWSDEKKPYFSEPIELLAIHRPSEFPSVWTQLREGRLKPGWVVVENRDPDPHWCRLLEGSGYRLKFFFHDDEYFELKP